MLSINAFVFNPLGENTYVLYDETRDCIIIDPGCYEPEEKEELKDFIQEEKLKVTLLINTHCHVDHVLGNYFVKKEYHVPLLCHAIEEPYLRAVKTYAPNYGFYAYQETEPDGFLKEHDTVTVGHQTLTVLFVPGHSPGHIALYHKESKSLIAGDVLFRNSIGRTDLPGGHHQTLIASIQQKLFALPDDVTVYPGHGPETTIGFEKKTNPFCALTV